MIVQSFIIVGYVWQILGSGGQKALPPPPNREQPRKSPSWVGLNGYQDNSYSIGPGGKNFLVDE